MNATAAAIDVIRRRVKATRDYSATEYFGEKPLLNWSAFLMHLDAKGILENSPRFKNNRK
jgi:hypothetical protein